MQLDWKNDLEPPLAWLHARRDGGHFMLLSALIFTEAIAILLQEAGEGQICGRIDANFCAEDSCCFQGHTTAAV